MTHDDIEFVAHQRGWIVEQCPFNGEYTFTKDGCKSVRLNPLNVAVHQLHRMLANAEKKASPAGELDRLETITQNSEKIGDTSMIYTKLLQFQSSGVTVHKNCTANLGGGRAYRYADLPSVLAAIKPALSSCGLVLVQSIDGTELTTRIVCVASGESLESRLPLDFTGLSWHQIGSAISYGRRYALTSLLGLAPDDDDDAVSTLPVKSTTSVGRGDGAPVVAAKRDLPPASCPHCGGAMSVGPKGNAYCADCWKHRRNGYNSMAAN
jgi:hypothetical protein